MDRKTIFEKITLRQEVECILTRFSEDGQKILRQRFGFDSELPKSFPKIASTFGMSAQSIESKKETTYDSLKRLIRDDKNRPLRIFLENLEAFFLEQTPFGFIEAHRFFELVKKEFALKDEDFPYLMFAVDFALNLLVDRMYFDSIKIGCVVIRYKTVNLNNIVNVIKDFQNFFQEKAINNLLKEEDAKLWLQSNTTVFVHDKFNERYSGTDRDEFRSGTEKGDRKRYEYFQECMEVLDFYGLEHGFWTKKYPAKRDCQWYVNRVLWDTSGQSGQALNYREVANRIFAEFSIVKTPSTVVECLRNGSQYVKVNAQGGYVFNYGLEAVEDDTEALIEAVLQKESPLPVKEIWARVCERKEVSLSAVQGVLKRRREKFEFVGRLGWKALVSGDIF